MRWSGCRNRCNRQMIAMPGWMTPVAASGPRLPAKQLAAATGATSSCAAGSGGSGSRHPPGRGSHLLRPSPSQTLVAQRTAAPLQAGRQRGRCSSRCWFQARGRQGGSHWAGQCMSSRPTHSHKPAARQPALRASLQARTRLRLLHVCRAEGHGLVPARLERLELRLSAGLGAAHLPGTACTAGDQH